MVFGGKILKKDIFRYYDLEKNRMLFKIWAPGHCDCCDKDSELIYSGVSWWYGWQKYNYLKENPLKTEADYHREVTYFDESDRNYELKLCAECIASGRAYQKMGARFNVSDYTVIDTQTPALISRLQFGTDFYWRGCCEEPCRYVCCISDLKEMYEKDVNLGATISPRLIGKTYEEAVKMIFNDVGEPCSRIKKAEEATDCMVYLFVCLNCGKFHTYWEYD